MNIFVKIIFGLIILVLSIVIAVDVIYLRSPISLKLVNVKGKTYLVTGSTAGIGLETVRGLAKMNATIIMAVRDEAKGNKVRQDILKSLADEKIPHSSNIIVKGGLDLNSQAKIRSFAESIKDTPIDVLVNNAGMATLEVETNVDGIESVFATNHLGPYLLTRLLEPNLVKAAASSGAKSRVVFLSSFMLFLGNADEKLYTFEDKGFNARNPMDHYSDSKLFNSMTAITLNDHYRQKGIQIVCNSVSPGYVVSDLDQNLPPIINKFAVTVRGLLGRPASESAIASLTVATSPELQNKGGYHFEDWCIMDLCKTCLLCNKYDMGVKILPSGRDETKRMHLWNVSNKLVGLSD